MPADHRQVECHTFHPFGGLLGGLVPQQYRDSRVVVLKRGYRGEEKARKHLGRSDTQFVLPPRTQVHESMLKGLGCFEDRTGVLEERLAFRSQLHAPSDPVEQRHLMAHLQFSDRVGDGLRRDEEQLRRSSKARLAGRGIEDPELVEIKQILKHSLSYR